MSNASNSGIVSGLGITNISLLSIARASLRYSSACGTGGVPLDDRFLVDFRPLHVVVAGQEVDHLGADLAGQLLDHFAFVVHLAAVADQPAEADAARLGILENSLADVVGGIHGHHLAGADDIDFLGLAFADRHGEAAADHVAQHVVEDIVGAGARAVGVELLQEVDGGDDAAAGTADARLRAAGLGAAAVADSRRGRCRRVRRLRLRREAYRGPSSGPGRPRASRVESALGSHPTTMTFLPISARAATVFCVVVDLPIPPLP